MTEISNSIQISTAVGQLVVKTGGPQDAERYFDQLATLYESDFVDPPLQGTYSFSKERLQKKLLEQYVTRPNFKIVTLWNGHELIGFVYGNSLIVGTRWWSGIREPLPDGFTHEDGNRTLALFDICVKRNLRGHGLSSQLHMTLLQGRIEERVTLLSAEERQPAYSIWRHWGYRKIGTTGSVEDRGVMDVFIRQLNYVTPSDNTVAGDQEEGMREGLQ
jgi:hypothetical protein